MACMIMKTTELEHDTLLLKLRKEDLILRRVWPELDTFEIRVLGKRCAESGSYLFYLKLGILYMSQLSCWPREE